MKAAFPLFQTIRHPQELEKLRAAWEPLQWNPYCDLDYLVWKFTRPGCLEEPHTIVMGSPGEPPVIVAGEICSRPIEFQLGYKRWRGPALKTLVIPRRGILGRASKEFWGALERELESTLLRGEVEAVLLRGFDPSGPVGGLSLAGVPSLCRLRTSITQEHWFVRAAGGFPTHKSRHKSFWHNVNNRRNRIQNRFGQGVLLRSYEQPGQLEDLLDQTETVARTTWQRRLGGQGFTSNEVRERYSHFLARGLLRAWVLQLDGRPAAFFQGLGYKGDFFAEVMGYDPTYSELGVGTYLTGLVLGSLLRENPDGLVDFGVGNSEAKSRFCDGFFWAADLFLVAPTPRLMALNTMRVAFLKAHLGLKKALSKGGLYHKVRSAWRYGGPAGRR